MTAGTLTRRRGAQRATPAPLVLASGRIHTGDTILRAWLQNKSPHTMRSYQLDLERFAEYLSGALAITPALKVGDALTTLFRQDSPGAHEIVLGFKTFLQGAGLSSATVNRYLAALRSVAKLARQLGVCPWYLEVQGERVERRRQTAGPTVEAIKELLAATSADTEADTRLCAIVLCLFTMGLRVSEVCGLNVEDTDLRRGNTWVLGKGRREKELVPIPSQTVEAITRYLRHRPGSPRGPLFMTKSRRPGKNRDGRLETRSVLRLVRNLGQSCAMHVWCHGFRHTGITVATEASASLGLSLDKVRAFSRHKNVTTLQGYIDDRHRDRNQQLLTARVAASLDD